MQYKVIQRLLLRAGSHLSRASVTEPDSCMATPSLVKIKTRKYVAHANDESDA
jgi:hypothetical protein